MHGELTPRQSALSILYSVQKLDIEFKNVYKKNSQWALGMGRVFWFRALVPKDGGMF